MLNDSQAAHPSRNFVFVFVFPSEYCTEFCFPASPWYLMMEAAGVLHCLI